MIIWINGAFGSGKTTTAYELQKRIPGSIVFDPEETGFFIGKNIPKHMQKEDFQDHEIWRSMNRQMIEYLGKHHRGVVICPMTVTNPKYLREMTSNLEVNNIRYKHVTLMACKQVLRKRLRARGELRNSWAEKQIDRCAKSLQRSCFGEHIHTDHLSINQVVEIIGVKCGLKLERDDRNFIQKKMERFLVWKQHVRVFG